jgi:Domain of unknown function (DU1801)
MDQSKPAKRPASAKGTTRNAKAFTDEEQAAMKERAREEKAARAGKSDGEAEVLAKIAEMPKADRAMAERLHALIKATAPELSPRTWYGMPAYAKDGKVVCHFQSAQKVQVEVCDPRLQRQGEPGQGRHVADLLRAQGVDRGRREEDRRARQAGGELIHARLIGDGPLLARVARQRTEQDLGDATRLVEHPVVDPR